MHPVHTPRRSSLRTLTIAVGLLACAGVAAGGQSAATLSVTVTVVRQCAVETTAATGFGMVCSGGAGRSSRVTLDRALPASVPAASVAGPSTQLAPDAVVLTVNF